MAFEGNFYSVPPGHRDQQVTVTRVLGADVIDIVSAAGNTLARHRLEVRGAHAVVRAQAHVAALEKAVLASAADRRAPCRRKQRIPPSPEALAEARRIRARLSGQPLAETGGTGESGPVVDFAVYAAAARPLTAPGDQEPSCSMLAKRSSMTRVNGIAGRNGSVHASTPCPRWLAWSPHKDETTPMLRGSSVPASTWRPNAWAAGVRGGRHHRQGPDTGENAACFGGPKSSPFPLLRLLVLAECATKSIIDAVACAYTRGERTAVHALLGSLRPGMLVLFDRRFCSHLFFGDAAATGADLIFRVSASFKLTPLPGSAAVLDDGTYLAELKPRLKRDGPPITVRVIEYSVTTRALGKGTTTSEVFCLVTNLLDPDQAPALELAGLYARRWKIEVLYKAVKIDLNGTRPVLRSGHADTVYAEIWSLLALFQILLRLADAAITSCLDDSGSPVTLDQISIKNARGALRRTIGQATAHMAEIAQVMVAFTEDVLSTLTPHRPRRTADRKRKARRGDKTKTYRVAYDIIP